MAYKIFLSPSNQDKNAYAYGNTTEDVQCGKIAKACETALKRCGFDVKLEQYDTMQNRVAHAEAWGADLHVPIHTNAYNGSVGGTRIFYYKSGTAGHKAAQAIYNALKDVTPGKSDNCTTADLYEIRAPQIPAAYVEAEFHDVPAYAKWIIENTELIGESICEGICAYFGITYKAATTAETPAEDKNTLFRVQTGAYNERVNADAQLKKVQAAGFDTYMVKVGELYKIQVGAYAERANAENMMAKVKVAGFDAFITTEQGQAGSSADTSAKTIEKGSRVKVKKGAKSYEGATIAAFVYNNVYTVDELKGNRAVLDLKGICTAFKTDDLILA